MISFFVWLFVISALNAGIVDHRRTVSCSWPGHCTGDSCITDNDCDGQLTCINGKCGNGGSGNDTCSPCGYLPGHE